MKKRKVLYLYIVWLKIYTVYMNFWAVLEIKYEISMTTKNYGKIWKYL